MNLPQAPPHPRRGEPLHLQVILRIYPTDLSYRSEGEGAGTHLVLFAVRDDDADGVVVHLVQAVEIHSRSHRILDELEHDVMQVGRHVWAGKQATSDAEDTSIFTSRHEHRQPRV